MSAAELQVATALPIDEVICGDCLEVLKGLPDGCCDLLLVDPPYEMASAGIPIRGCGVAARQEETMSVGEPWGSSLEWIDVAAGLHPRHWVIFSSYKMLGKLCVAIERHANIGAIFTWRKPNAPRMARPVPRLDTEFIVWARSEDATCLRMGEFETTVLDIPFPPAGCFASERILQPGSGKAAHPCQKPLTVLRPFVDRACPEGGTVLVPFSGLGSAEVACAELGRHFIGIEQDPHYCDIARARIAAAKPEPNLFGEGKR